MSTKSQVTAVFERFCKLYNLKTTATWSDADGKYSNDRIKLDYSPQFGGYRLDVVQVSTSERFFDDMGRRSAKEMIAYLQGLIAAKQSYSFENIVNNG